ncbi:MAG: Rrf2 family transcriptional regulator [Candidatus Omnitrophica bacterium]|nr:Rrf2 family transcriptional regulator [Candidatus Omnitrophota bacterium]
MLSKTSTQVIKAFIELAKLEKGEYQGAGAIAQSIMAPRNYLGKMLQSMASHGLVVSQKGTGGGFRLARPASKITLYDIVEPIDNVTLWSECALGLKRCTDSNPCVIHHRWKAVREAYYDFLKSTRISDLV